MRIINDYTATLKPELSLIWHTDEMMIKSGGRWRWLWNVMDEQSRFIIASRVSAKRDVYEARQLFAKAVEQAGMKPNYVVTDGLQAYGEAIRKELRTMHSPRNMHRRLPTIRGIPNNNAIERLQGTIRERDKVLRGIKKDDSPIIEGIRNYYNFIRPHQTFDGKTPAEVANLNLELAQNKWLSLIRKSAEHR